MTENGFVRSETILREVRARVLALVKNPPSETVDANTWEIELRALGQLEVIYSRPEIIPLATGDTRFAVRP